MASTLRRRVIAGSAAAVLGIGMVTAAGTSASAAGYNPGWYSANPLAGAYGTCSAEQLVAVGSDRLGMYAKVCVHATARFEAQPVVVMRNSSRVSAANGKVNVVVVGVVTGKPSVSVGYTCDYKTVPANRTYYCLGKNGNFSSIGGAGVTVKAAAGATAWYNSTAKSLPTTAPISV